MPWKEKTTVSLRMEFIKQALMKDVNISQLCREYGISRKTGYKWLRRYLEEGEEGLQDRSRRPHHSPQRTPAEVEQRVLEVRKEHPAWGGRKIQHRLKMLGAERVPPASTITEILRRHDCLDPDESRKHRPWQRFEAEGPNQMWQMDFKGYFTMTNQHTCHPLTLLDDHARFCLGLRACPNERRETVQDQLIAIFQQYGLPDQLLMDNGPPWGTTQRKRLTRLGVWLVRLGIELIHTGFYHPQTIGKDERFHRTLKAEVLQRYSIRNLAHAQDRFDPWRQIYNHHRPHEALDMQVPAQRYQVSAKPFPETLPPVEYEPGSMVRKVDQGGKISFRGHSYRVGRALWGLPVAVRPVNPEGWFEVYFCHHKVASIDVRKDV